MPDWEHIANKLNKDKIQLSKELSLFSWAYDRIKLLMEHSNHEYAIKEAKEIDLLLEKELKEIRDD